MFQDLKPYHEYKDSDLPWLGKVPAHWEVKRGKNLFQCIDVRSETGEEELLTVSSERGLVPRRSATVTMFKAESYVGHKLCWPSDLVINSLWAWARGIGVSQHYGIVSTAYGVYRGRVGVEIDPRFIHELVRSVPFHWELLVRSKGVWTSRLQLTDDSFLGAPFPLPPLSEQTAIVRFLGHADRRIRRYIVAKQKLIKLLEEQKQAIIHRAVTRGLDPNVPLKPSGVDWLGDIPVSYKRTRLGRVCLSIRDGTHNPPSAVPGIHRCLSVRNIINGRFVTRNDDRTMTPEAFAELQRSYTVNVGDIVIAIVGATTGKSAVVEQMDNVTVQRSLGILRTNNAVVLSSFLNLMITSDIVQDQIRQIMVKYAAQPGIYLTDLGGLQIFYPGLQAQQAIVNKVGELIAPLFEAMRRANNEVNLIREYRTRLIADVVTGKLDVLAAAANLRDDPDELETFEESSRLESDDEDISESNLESAPEEAEA